jgi:metal-responsive CopG/Arc/MetJ family transcriptional regulator
MATKRARKTKYMIYIEPKLLKQLKELALQETEGNTSLLIRQALKEYVLNHDEADKNEV